MHIYTRDHCQPSDVENGILGGNCYFVNDKDGVDGEYASLMTSNRLDHVSILVGS